MVVCHCVSVCVHSLCCMWVWVWVGVHSFSVLYVCVCVVCAGCGCECVYVSVCAYFVCAVYGRVGDCVGGWLCGCKGVMDVSVLGGGGTVCVCVYVCVWKYVACVSCVCVLLMHSDDVCSAGHDWLLFCSAKHWALVTLFVVLPSAGLNELWTLCWSPMWACLTAGKSDRVWCSAFRCWWFDVLPSDTVAALGWPAGLYKLLYHHAGNWALWPCLLLCLQLDISLCSMLSVSSVCTYTDQQALMTLFVVLDELQRGCWTLSVGDFVCCFAFSCWYKHRMTSWTWSAPAWVCWKVWVITLATSWRIKMRKCVCVCVCARAHARAEFSCFFFCIFFLWREFTHSGHVPSLRVDPVFSCFFFCIFFLWREFTHWGHVPSLRVDPVCGGSSAILGRDNLQKWCDHFQFLCPMCSHLPSSVVDPNSKHWFTTSFLQPLLYLVMP